MGSTQNISSENTLNVATLNYSGLLKSPYEFYEQGEHGTAKAELGKIFYDQQMKKKLPWQFDKLEKKWQDKRYSPLYLPSCGINNCFMMNKKEFQKQWDSQREKSQKYIEKSLGKVEDKIFDNLKLFDVLIYKSILLYVFKDKENETKIIDNFFEEKEQDESKKQFSIEAKLYRKHQKNMFSRKFLNQNFKIALIEEFIVKYNIDIFMMQEVSHEFIDHAEKKMPEFRLVKAIDFQNPQMLISDSIILIRDDKFKIRSLREENMIFHNNIKEINQDNKEVQKLTDEQIKNMNLNEDTIVQAIGNLFLISCHLTSKQKKKKDSDIVNKDQLILLHKLLTNLKIWFPHCQYIVGGNLNGDYYGAIRQHLSQKPTENIFPEQFITTHKIRTILQIQKEKAHVTSKGIKDHLVSSLDFIEKKVMDIKGRVIAEKQENNTNNKKDSENLTEFMSYSKNELKAKAEELCNSNSLVPSDRHPFDHLIVYGKVRLNKQIMHTSSHIYRKMYKPEDLTEKDIELIDKQQEEKQLLR